MGKMLFHPPPERPTEPNAGIVRYESGSYHPEHCHGFAQVGYILSGEFTIEGKLLKAGTMLFHPDPSPRVRRAAPHLIFHLKKNPWTFPLIPVLEAQGPFRPNQI
jgi:hypothetical protein